MAKLFRNPFKKKADSIKLNEVSKDALINRVPAERREIYLEIARAMNLSPSKCSDDNMTLFLNTAEVFFPIDFIASRIAGAHYEIKKVKDDSIVWCTGRSQKVRKLSDILTRPNCLQTFSQFVYSHFVYKLVDGQGFIRAAMSDLLSKENRKWEMCDNFWSIPPSQINIQQRTDMPLFGICDIDEIIEGYRIGESSRVIPSWQIWHDRDLTASLGGMDGPVLMSPSRLEALRPVIATLKAVYDARNIIYNRCGALGVLTNKAQDDTGHIAMTPDEKEELNKYFADNFGVTAGKNPMLVTNASLEFLRTGLSISDLQPFEETLLDAIVIAGQYGIPADLVPRKDNSTYDNKSAAEKGVYSGVIIPMAKKFCQDFTEFLGCEDDGYYIDCNFDDVDCLQVGRKESENVKTMVNDRCRRQFLDGLISINDWRGQIHEASLEGEVYGKTRFEMTDEELSFIGRVINNNISNRKTPQQENGKDNEESAGADENE